MSLEAVERNDLSRLPGGIFTRAFVRAYAEEVGLDPDRTIQDFIAELPPEAATATAHSAAVEDGEQLDADRRAVATGIRLVLVAVPIVGLVIFLGTRRSAQTSPPAAVVQSPGSSVPATAPPAPAPSAVRPVSPEGATGARATSGFTIEIAPKAAVWVSATVDGEPTFSGMMNPGEKKVVSAREEILITVGDAGAFAYTLNGSPGRPLGAPGEVVSTRLTVANYKDHIAP